MSLLDQVRLIPLKVHADARGVLYEMIRPPLRPVQSNLVAVAPWASRGGHYHRRKTEWFCAVQGRALFRLRDAAGGAERELELHGPALLEIPPGIWHGLTNPEPRELLLVIFIDEAFDSSDPDTHTEGGGG